MKNKGISIFFFLFFPGKLIWRKTAKTSKMYFLRSASAFLKLFLHILRTRGNLCITFRKELSKLKFHWKSSMNGPKDIESASKNEHEKNLAKKCVYGVKQNSLDTMYIFTFIRIHPSL